MFAVKLHLHNSSHTFANIINDLYTVSCITDSRIASLLYVKFVKTSMDIVEDQRPGESIHRLADCHYLISSDHVRINMDKLRRLTALTNRSFYSYDKPLCYLTTECKCKAKARTAKNQICNKK